MDNQTKIIYWGLLRSAMSWAKIGREMVLALDSLGCDINVREKRGFGYEKSIELESKLQDLIMPGWPDDVSDRCAFTFTYPANYNKLEGKKRIGMLVYETPNVPESWISNINKYLDMLILPNQYNYDIFKKNGVLEDNMRILPYGIDTNIYKPGKRENSFGLKEKYIFYCIAMPHKRKGLDILFSAYKEEFRECDDVCLVVKLPYVKNKDNNCWEDNKTARDIIAWDKAGKTPRIKTIVGFCDKQDMGSYYRSVDCYVQPSFIEGFGMTIIEAFACKIPVITTGFSGQMDFCNTNNTFIIKYKKEKSMDMQYDTNQKEVCVARPDKIHLRVLLREMYENRNNDKIKNKVENAYETSKRYCWKKIAKEFLCLSK